RYPHAYNNKSGSVQQCAQPTTLPGAATHATHAGLLPRTRHPHAYNNKSGTLMPTTTSQKVRRAGTAMPTTTSLRVCSGAFSPPRCQEQPRMLPMLACCLASGTLMPTIT
ncbi:hypothetical protein V8C86DRAFT_2446066, partial [Haematococcus lacustris]